jgi:hypothetical protein
VSGGFLDLLERLVRTEVDFVIVGGYAGVFRTLFLLGAGADK